MEAEVRACLIFLHSNYSLFYNYNGAQSLGIIIPCIDRLKGGIPFSHLRFMQMSLISLGWVG